MSRAPRVLYFQFTNAAYYPPIVHSTRILADRGFEVMVLGAESAPGRTIQFEPHPSIRVSNLPYQSPGPLQKLHYLRFAARVIRNALSFKPDWCYASDLWSCPVGLALTGLGFRVIYHEHDLTDSKNASPFVQGCLAARSALATRAALCVFPNQQRTRAFSDQHPDARTATVLNCAALADIGPARAVRSGPLRLYYHGSIVPDRLPISLLEALALSPATRLTIRGYETIGTPGYGQQLVDAAASLGVADRVELLSLAHSRAELWPSMSNADVGIALIPTRTPDANLEHLAGASNKPFDYLARGMALLFTHRPDWTEPFGAYGRACVPEDGRSIATALHAFSSDPALAHDLGAAGQARCGTDWNYEHQFAPVLRVMNA